MYWDKMISYINMQKLRKYGEGAIYFYVGALLILVLDYVARSTGYQFGYNYAPEGGPGLGMSVLLLFTVAYYGTFLAVQHGLSRLCKQILELQYLLPASLAAGVVVSFSFLSDLDFLFWLVYRKDMGTIFLSVLVIEIVFLLMNAGIVWRIVRAERISASYVRVAILILVFIALLIVFWLPEMARIQ
jgi:hypothetical protein